MGANKTFRYKLKVESGDFIELQKQLFRLGFSWEKEGVELREFPGDLAQDHVYIYCFTNKQMAWDLRDCHTDYWCANPSTFITYEKGKDLDLPLFRKLKSGYELTF